MNQQIDELKNGLRAVLVRISDRAWTEQGVFIGRMLIDITVEDLPFGNLSSARNFLGWMTEIEIRGFRDKKNAEGVERFLRLINNDVLVKRYALEGVHEKNL